MYFPYFRGKQYELVLLKEQSSQVLSSKKIVPIIEPVKQNLNPLQRTIEEFKTNNIPYVLISNPEVGDFSSQNRDTLIDFIFQKADKDITIVGIIANASTAIDDLQHLFNIFKDYKIAIIHKGFSDAKVLLNLLEKNSTNILYNIFISNGSDKRYRRKFKNIGQSVIVKDGFKKTKNADYNDNELFSDLHLDFIEENLDGFGDFLIVGDDYSESGGPAWAVAIHMTYLKKDADDEMFIKHYISDRRDDNKDAGGKFIEALKYLVEDEKKYHLYNTKASQEYIELYEKKLFRGLGYAKKLSMQNHLEIIARFLEEHDG